MTTEAPKVRKHGAPQQEPPSTVADGTTIRPDGVGTERSTLEPVSRTRPEIHEDRGEHPASKEQGRPPRQRDAIGLLLWWGRGAATLAIMLVAAVMGVVTWDYYVTAPWTRDGRVRVQVASVAPKVSGQITELRVADNQYVHKGEVLYVIEPFDFEVALRESLATAHERGADLEVKQVQSQRRQSLGRASISPEQQQVYAGSAAQAQAAFEAAQHQVAQARINLSRTQVRSPVNGYVTNLLMRVGDYAHRGVSNISVIDADSYWIDGYFEETKMARICIGDRVEAKFMGYSQPILGHVATVTRGIGVSNAAAGAQGLPNVDPVYTWVRLAQRVPVRITIDSVPPGIPLVSGMTATVTIRDAADTARRAWPDRVMAAIKAGLSNVFYGPPARPGCIPAITTEHGKTESLPKVEEELGPTPQQVDPSLAPGMDVSPGSH